MRMCRRLRGWCCRRWCCRRWRCRRWCYKLMLQSTAAGAEYDVTKLDELNRLNHGRRRRSAYPRFSLCLLRCLVAMATILRRHSLNTVTFALSLWVQPGISSGGCIFSIGLLFTHSLDSRLGLWWRSIVLAKTNNLFIVNEWFNEIKSKYNNTTTKNRLTLCLSTKVSLKLESKQVLHCKQAGCRFDLQKLTGSEENFFFGCIVGELDQWFPITHFSSVETPGISQDQWRCLFTLLNSTLGVTTITEVGRSIRSHLMINTVRPR